MRATNMRRMAKFVLIDKYFLDNFTDLKIWY